MKTRRTRSMLAATAVVGLALAGVTSGPSQAVTTATLGVGGHATRGGYLDPATLPAGPAPKRAYLAGLTITSKTGKKVAIPLPAAQIPNLTLLGNSTRGFIVKDFADSYHVRFYAIPKSGVKKLLFTAVDGEGDIDWYFAHDGTRIMSFENDRGDESHAAVLNLDGHVLGGINRPVDGQGVLDFSGPKAVVGVGHPVYTWTIGHAPVSIGSVRALSADIAHNLLFVDDGAGDYGPTSLSAPGTPGWSEPFIPRLVSATGAYVLGFAPNGVAIQVRSMTDGTLLSTKAIRHPGDFVAWEDATHYLVVAQGSTGSALVRCTAVSSVCRRTTPMIHKHLTMSVS